MVVIKCKMLEINQIIGFMEQFFKEYLTYFQPTTTLHYHSKRKFEKVSFSCYHLKIEEKVYGAEP